MNFEEKVISVTIGDKPLVFRTGKIAKQAGSAVVASHGDTTVLTSACMSDNIRTGIDFFPLVVDFEERYYSAGKIPGGFIKREGRPSDTAILSGRMTDRSIRSLFDETMRNEVQVITIVLSVDQVYPPNVLAINAASMALTLSDIPWGGPVGAVRIGYVDGSLVVNPTETQIAVSELDLLVAGHDDGITMVECGAKELPETVLIDAMDLAQTEIRKITAVQRELRDMVGKPKRIIAKPETCPEIDQWIENNLRDEIRSAVLIHEKGARHAKTEEIKVKAQEHFAETHAEWKDYINDALEGQVKKIMRVTAVNEGVRADGRAMDELRPVTCEVGVLPRVHGSALFTRGETQALAVTTLGMMGEDDQVLDGLKQDEPSKRFILHYNFPPFSVGEVRPMRGPGRREVGHGALAERALRAVIPDEADFPYVMRVVSDILESNGSSSQASVCGGSLSLMQAGVPIKRHVAGIAMGLIKEGESVQILTDIQGLEDHYGDMDFKVAGSRNGVTALQMDNKAGGITREILERALEQARIGRFQILEKMEAVMPEPNQLSPDAPRISQMIIDTEKIRDVIGPGGKTIRGITQKTGVKINVEDSGEVCIAGATQEKVDEAMAIIRGLTKDLEAGEMYCGTVTRMLAFGAFVECLPGKEGLLHISEVSTFRIPKIEDAFSIGDTVLVIVKEIDDMGRVNLTRRRILEDERRIMDEGLEYAIQTERDREEKLKKISDEARSAPPPSRDRDSVASRDRDRRPHGGGSFRRDRD
ncbi:MAG: polyribonucleotide nucleotidyltransferase [Synergistaceae bacterium]|nr:polyribonucleotide nucleotidyltransferase [Synergistaceae bacterium]